MPPPSLPPPPSPPFCKACNGNEFMDCSYVQTYKECAKINLLFSVVEGLCWENFGLNLSNCCFLFFFHCDLSQFFLFIVMIKDGGHILWFIPSGRVMIIPEYAQQISVICLLWVIFNLYGLCVITPKKK